MPEPERGAVLMKVTYSGICGTDKHTYRGESKQYAGTDHERDIVYPLICGHENVGVIEAIGGADSIPDSEGRPLRRFYRLSDLGERALAESAAQRVVRAGHRRKWVPA